MLSRIISLTTQLSSERLGSMNMDLLKEEKNRGYLIAGIGGLVGLIAFFLPYITFSFLGVGGSVGGASLGWVWFEEYACRETDSVWQVRIDRWRRVGLAHPSAVRPHFP